MHMHVHTHVQILTYPAHTNTNAAACASIHKSHNGMLFFTFCELLLFFFARICDPINSVTK